MSVKVKFAFEEADDFRVHPCQGAWGGFSGNGYVVANFFIDVARNPDNVIMRQGQGGAAEEVARHPAPVENPEEIEVRRILTTAIMLRPEEAMVVGQWLIAQANEGLAALGRQVSSDDKA